MRKSVERRNRAEKAVKATHTRHVKKQRRIIMIAIIGILVICAAIGAIRFLAPQTSVQAAAHTTSSPTPNLFDALLASANKAENTTKDQSSKSLQDAKNGFQVATSTPHTSIASSSGCDVNDPTSISVVVNKKHCINPPSWAPSDLTSVAGYLMRSVAASHMQQMMNDAAAAGQGFSISSAYRSYSDQVATYNNWVQVNGSTAAADTVSARPGYSEHQTGLAADLKAGGCVLECFANTSQYQWLTANAANYGFIQRYPVGLTSITGYSPEQWHWRYVGSATALAMKAQGIQTLEQYFNISGGDYN